MRVNIITLGCSKNSVDSENIAGHLRKAGHQVFFDRQQHDCDTISINTCVFIGDAKEESVTTLVEQVEVKSRGRKARRIIAVGCLVERYREELRQELPEIDAFYGVHEWDALIASLLPNYAGPFEHERTISTPSHYG